jgi:hypothetical protein
MASGDKTSTDPVSDKSKSLVNKDGSITKLTEWATQDVDTIDEAIAKFGEAGITYSTGGELTGDYRVITAAEKQQFLKTMFGRKVFIVRWEFYKGQNGEFVAFHCIIDESGKFIINDGSKGGIYGQLSGITTQRLDSGIGNGREKSGVLCERGFVENKPFYFRTGPEGHPLIGKAIPRSEVDDVPAEHKQLAKPTWRLEF